MHRRPRLKVVLLRAEHDTIKCFFCSENVAVDGSPYKISSDTANQLVNDVRITG